jgi:uncharacterized membrane protein HdeD (DUF308 family)
MASGPSDSSNGGAEESGLARTLATLWWVWLIVGILWIAASVIILQFNRTSVTFVGIVISVMFVVAGIQEFVIAFMTSTGWRWLWVAFGILLVFSGIWALLNPAQTVVAIASIVGFVFVLMGIGWTIQAFAAMTTSDFWGLQLIAGILMIVLGFWAATQLLVTQAYALLIFAGIWALLHGVTDVVRAFLIQRAGNAAFAG